MRGDQLAHLERLLTPLGRRLPPASPGDWLWENPEPGQTFPAYRASHPARKSPRWHTIYLSLVGDFTPAQEAIIGATAAYLEVFFDCPVRRHRLIPVGEIPARFQRPHPFLAHRQLHSTFILEDLLLPDRPDDALASVAITADDLWCGEGWN